MCSSKSMLRILPYFSSDIHLLMENVVFNSSSVHFVYTNRRIVRRVSELKDPFSGLKFTIAVFFEKVTNLSEKQ